MRSTLFAALGLVALSAATPAFAAGAADDAAYDKNKSTVIDTRGNCVRTKWQGEQDPCGTAAPAAKPVAAAPRPAPVVAAPVVSRENRTVYFDFNKSIINASEAAKLDELASIINASSSITDVAIHGYTDQIGTASYNDALATKRVAAVKAYLDGKSRLKADGDVRGLGKSSPDAACDGIKNRAQKIRCMSKERRVEIEFNAQK